MSGIAELSKKVLKEITPSPADSRAEAKMVRSLLKKIKGTRGTHTGAVLAGSLARNTHLKGDRDLDIFVFYPPKLPREKFEKAGLRLGHSVFGKAFHEEAYSEHPYVRGELDGFRVEIVPTYKVERATEKRSAVDRTPFHAAYMKKNLSQKQCGEVRLLKQFLKGIRVYGADIRYQGVPGYLVEILILKYGSFEKALRAIAEWKDHTIVDLENSFASSKEAMVHFSDAFLLIVDPTDANRNVAAALSYNQFARMILAARAFLKKPARYFFFGKNAFALTPAQIRKYFAQEELVGIQFPYPQGVLADVVWGQLHRLSGKLAHALEQRSFSIRRTFVWTDESAHAVILLDVENPLLPRVQTRKGPKVVEAKHADAFLKAHPSPLSGPRVEEGRIVMDVQRAVWKIRDALPLEWKKLVETEAEERRVALAQGHPIFEAHMRTLMRADASFAHDLSVFLKGREPFL